MSARRKEHGPYDYVIDHEYVLLGDDKGVALSFYGYYYWGSPDVQLVMNLIRD